MSVSGPSDSTDLSEQLASIAHEAWRRRMTVAGWAPSHTYDEQARLHDALVPFDQLSRHDRRAIIEAVRSEKVEERLAALVEYLRGPDRPFTIEEMRPGLPVQLASCPCEGERAVQPEQGTIESWLTDDAGELNVMRVRWADGDLSEHHPAARELRRV